MSLGNPLTSKIRAIADANSSIVAYSHEQSRSTSYHRIAMKQYLLSAARRLDESSALFP